MQPFRFVHAADLHIGSPFTRLRSKAAGAVEDRLQDATYAAFDNLISVCIDERVDFIVIAGDVYDGANRLPRDQLHFWNGMRRLTEAGIQAFVVHGNHDHLGGRYSSMAPPPGVHVFERTDLRPEWAFATRNGVPIAQIQGVSYPQREVRENLALRFEHPPDPDIYSIGLMHCNVGGIREHDDYAPCTVADLTATPIDYWALGHIHKRQSLGREKVRIEYPGNLQGRDVGETDAKGCLLVTVDANGAAECAFTPVDVVRWSVANVPVGGLTTLDGLLDALHETVERLKVESQGRDTAARLALTGRSDLARELRDAGGVAAITGELNQSATASSPWVWVESIEDRTRPPLDIDAISRSDGFVGELLREAANAGPEEFEDALAEVFSGRHAGRNGPISPPGPEEIAGWIEEARWLLAERFTDPESTR